MTPKLTGIGMRRGTCMHPHTQSHILITKAIVKPLISRFFFFLKIFLFTGERVILHKEKLNLIFFFSFPNDQKIYITSVGIPLYVLI